MMQLDNKIALVTGAGGGKDGGTVAHVPGFTQFAEMMGAH